MEIGEQRLTSARIAPKSGRSPQRKQMSAQGGELNRSLQHRL
jgi:hypothetical protein